MKSLAVTKQMVEEIRLHHCTTHKPQIRGQLKYLPSSVLLYFNPGQSYLVLITARKTLSTMKDTSSRLRCGRWPKTRNGEHENLSVSFKNRFQNTTMSCCHCHYSQHKHQWNSCGKAATSTIFGADLTVLLPYAFGAVDSFFATYTDEMVGQCYAPLGEVEWSDPDELLDMVGQEYRAAENMFAEFWKLAHLLIEQPSKIVALAEYLVAVSRTLPPKEVRHAA